MELKIFTLKVSFIALFSIIFLTHSYAQLNEGGSPYSLTKQINKTTIPKVIMDPIDLNQIILEDQVNDNSTEQPYRFGIEHEVALNLNNSGLWQELPNGDRLWRLAIEAPEALSINLIFNDFYLPEGSKLFLYNEGYEQILGAFTAKNNKNDKTFGTALVYGELSYLEYYEPAKVKGKGSMNINTVVHGYRSIFVKDNNQLGNSGACNVDTECPQADNWRDVLKSAAKTIGGGFLCSGTLVGNTTGDRRPLFLTANHCGFFSTVVVYWRFERPNCGSGIPDDTQTTSGAIVLADVDGSPGGGIRSSDHLLLELLENPADSYDVYFAGWDATGAIPQTITGIHHPSGDAKKISMENDPLTSTAYLNSSIDPNQSHWRVEDWDSGTTEGGSSGSAIYDNVTQRIVGLLSGGFAACGNNSDDWYGKFSYAWTNNGTTDPSERLMDWLDPNNTGLLTIDGYGLSDFALSTTNPSVSTCGIDVALNYDLTVVSGFTGTVSFTVTGLPAGTSGTFNTNPASSGGAYSLNVTGIASAASGIYTVTITGTDGTDSIDLNFELVVDTPILTGPALSSPVDGAIDQNINVPFTWTSVPGASSYTITIATDAAFTNIVETGNSSTNSYSLVNILNNNTRYYWSVAATNSCGDGPNAMAWTFGTVDATCSTVTATDVPIFLFTFGTSSNDSEIAFTGNNNISHVSVSLDIEHTNISDLEIELVSPAGTIVQIHSGLCPGSADLLETFSDTGAPYSSIPCPPIDNGNYMALGSFSDFNGEASTGTWTLNIVDNVAVDGGVFNGWSLTICTDSPSSIPPPTDINGCKDVMAHNYDFTATIDDGSCISCNDGIMNGDEVGVDCGGTNPNCSPCMAMATCSDGIMNQDETGIDCGGATCAPCMGCTDPLAHNYDAIAGADDGSCETCSDGIMNGDEAGVDCGGSNPNCPICPCTDVTLTYTGPFNIPNNTHKLVDNWIIMDGSAGTVQLPGTRDASFRAGNFIELLPEFNVNLGATILLDIEPCN